MSIPRELFPLAARASRTRSICFFLAQVAECIRNFTETAPMAWRHWTNPEEVGGR